MQLMYEIPDSFWSLFRSVNRAAYMEALLILNEEYQYNNYFLSRDVCIQILGDFYAKKRVALAREDNENDQEASEPPASRILNWLIRTGWLRRQEDYESLTANIVIPDYAAVFLEAFERLTQEDSGETDIYIQNIYATLFSFRTAPTANEGMLKTALINTRQLNRSLQTMLHSMEGFFGRLLEQTDYGALLGEHLNGYVEDVVGQKYHILKTGDNFYRYKTDIKKWLREMREDEDWLATLPHAEETLDLVDAIERGFDDIEHRIESIDREHSKYVRATVTRLGYLLNREEDMKGLLVQLMTAIGGENMDERLAEAAGRMNLSSLDILSEKSLYKPRKLRADFISQMEEREEETPRLSTREVLRLNRMQGRYSRKEIREFLDSHARDGVFRPDGDSVRTPADFEKLILAYDDSLRRDSRYVVTDTGKRIQANGYSYPALIFTEKKKESASKTGDITDKNNQQIEVEWDETANRVGQLN